LGRKFFAREPSGFSCPPRQPPKGGLPRRKIFSFIYLFPPALDFLLKRNFSARFISKNGGAELERRRLRRFLFPTPLFLAATASASNEKISREESFAICVK